MEKKITKRERFMQLLAISQVSENAELVEFINHEIELLNKKAENKGNSKIQKENEVIKVNLLNALAEVNAPVTISELQKVNEYVSQFSNQKISALFKQLEKENLIVRTVEKGKAYFTVA